MRTNKILAALASFTVIAAANAQSRTYEWTGSTDDKWQEPGNWNQTDGAPQFPDYPDNSGNKAIITDVDDGPSLEADISIGYLEIQADAKLTLNDNTFTFDNTSSMAGEFIISGGGQCNADGAFAINSGSTLDIQSDFSGDGIFDVGGTTTYNAGTITIGGILRMSSGGQFDQDANLSLESGGTIDIQSGCGFDIGAVTFTYNGGTLTINGELRLTDEDSIFAVDGDCTPGGSGSIVGQDPAARIKIANTKTFTVASGFTIEGEMGIEGLTGGGTNGTLDNDGTVQANVVNGTLELMANTRLNGSSGDFRADIIASATLKFSEPHTNCGDITGDFFVDNGATLEFSEDIWTNGNFTCAGSGVVSGTLKYGTSCSSTAGSC